MVQRYTSIMNNFDRVASFYQNHIEQISLSVDAVVAATSVAAEAAAATIFSERKLIICGLGLDAASATLLSELLRNGLAHERPALPTIELMSRFSTPKEGSVNWLAPATCRSTDNPRIWPLSLPVTLTPPMQK